MKTSAKKINGWTMASFCAPAVVIAQCFILPAFVNMQPESGSWAIVTPGAVLLLLLMLLVLLGGIAAGLIGMEKQKPGRALAVIAPLLNVLILVYMICRA